MGKIIDHTSSTAKYAKITAKIRKARYVGHRSWVPLLRVDIQAATEIELYKDEKSAEKH